MEVVFVNRKLEIIFPDFGISLIATMLEDKVPEHCESLWASLPMEGVCVHPLSTGDMFGARCRPPRKAQKVGTQDNPLTGEATPLCDYVLGDIEFTGLDFWVTYGPNITEPLLGEAPITAKVDPEYLNDLNKAGKAVWHNQKSVHKAVKMIVKRKE